jgi:hypothetical protein
LRHSDCVSDHEGRALSLFADFPLAPAPTIDHERVAFAQAT